MLELDSVVGFFILIGVRVEAASFDFFAGGVSYSHYGTDKLSQHNGICLADLQLLAYVVPVKVAMYEDRHRDVPQGHRKEPASFGNPEHPACVLRATEVCKGADVARAVAWLVVKHEATFVEVVTLEYAGRDRCSGSVFQGGMELARQRDCVKICLAPQLNVRGLHLTRTTLHRGLQS